MSQKNRPVESPYPAATYMLDGDFIEVVLAPDSSIGERLSDNITVHRSRRTKEIVCVKIRGIAELIAKAEEQKGQPRPTDGMDLLEAARWYDEHPEECVPLPAVFYDIDQGEIEVLLLDTAEERYERHSWQTQIEIARHQKTGEPTRITVKKIPQLVREAAA